MKCIHCGRNHSDWFGCEQAETLGLVENEPEPEKLVEKPAKPPEKFDRSAKMKQFWAEKRKKRLHD